MPFITGVKNSDSSSICREAAYENSIKPMNWHCCKHVGVCTYMPKWMKAVLE